MKKNKILDNRPATTALCIKPSSLSTAIRVVRKPNMKKPHEISKINKISINEI
tara:strand:- start:196 stop:354 length:159 start_codon:yes stop_codon:yes gene_type:complete